MRKWAFQLLPMRPGVLSKGYRVDPHTQALEDEVNARLQRKFEFHGIQKLVVRLGPKEGIQDYEESMGVAWKHYPQFDVVSYKALTPEEKTTKMRRIVLEVLDWLIASFTDAQYFEKAKQELEWSQDSQKPNQ